jgi:hypothetical protein
MFLTTRVNIRDEPQACPAFRRFCEYARSKGGDRQRLLDKELRPHQETINKS